MARSKASGSDAKARKAGQSSGDSALAAYNEMLRDALSSSPSPGTVEDRPIKRRKTAGGHTLTSTMCDPTESSAPPSIADKNVEVNDTIQNPALKPQQVAYSDSDDSAESETDWEEVDLAQPSLQEDLPLAKDDEKLNLVLGGGTASTSMDRPASKRKPVTAVERKLRLELHKVHVLCLVAHVHLRNHWCNDETVHKSLRVLLSKKTVSYLNPDAKGSQFQRTRAFADGLKQAVDAFKLQFKVTARGMSRSYWAESGDGSTSVDLPKQLDLPIQMTDFCDLAQQREASRDVGAQLFCALLRSVGVDARLVCSLQPLPFIGSAKGRSTPATKLPVYMAIDRNAASGESGSDTDGLKAPRQGNPNGPIGSVGGRSRFASGSSLGSGHQLPQGAQTSSSLPPPGHNLLRPKRIVESSHPIYWVEAFDEAAQKWICVDPLVTKTIGKPYKLEPPISDAENNMSYVFAFEDDGSARDVTRRYVKAYNAKTYKNRVESTQLGAKWLKRVLRLYKRPHTLDRDQIEDTEFTRKEAQEPLPENVQDFKSHPYYALERHLRRNEAIHPKREVGKVMNGRAGSAKGSEPIYRRRDVHVVRSADKWYRMGREIKPGEQPLKRVAARKKRQGIGDLGDSDAGDDEDTHTALYAVHQTSEYRPPPVVNGRIPKNVYGNLDVYAPNMVPPGAAHVMHPESARAARLLGVDYADAVTGFAFKGRHGTAILNGAVVAAEYVTAIQETIGGFVNERVQEEEARRSLAALRMWRRFLTGLRVRERIEGYTVEGEAGEPHEERVDPDDESENYESGGFFPTGEADDEAVPTAVGVTAQVSDDAAGGEFFADDATMDLESGGLLDGSENSVSSETYLDKIPANDHDQDVERAKQDSVWPTPVISVVYGKDVPSSLPKRGEDNLGGGFVVDGHPERSESSPPRVSDRELTPFIPADGDISQAIMLQQAYENQSLASPPSEHGGIMTDSKSTHIAARLSVPTDLAVRPPDNVEIPATAEANPTHAESGMSAVQEDLSDDQGSLLSEDPDDEDADPEWLV